MAQNFISDENDREATKVQADAHLQKSLPVIGILLKTTQSFITIFWELYSVVLKPICKELRTVDLFGSHFQPLEDTIHKHFIPALTGRDPCSELERELLALPCRFGGLNILNPTTLCEFQFSASKKISGPLSSLILEQSIDFSIPSLLSIKSEIRQARHQLLTSNFNDIKSRLDFILQRNIDLLTTKCSSVWLTALPIQEQGFHLNKQEFRDALCLRYGFNFLIFQIIVFVDPPSVLIMQ